MEKPHGERIWKMSDENERVPASQPLSHPRAGGWKVVMSSGTLSLSPSQHNVAQKHAIPTAQCLSCGMMKRYIWLLSWSTAFWSYFSGDYLNRLSTYCIFYIYVLKYYIYMSLYMTYILLCYFSIYSCFISYTCCQYFPKLTAWFFHFVRYFWRNRSFWT